MLYLWVLCPSDTRPPCSEAESKGQENLWSRWKARETEVRNSQRIQSLAEERLEPFLCLSASTLGTQEKSKSLGFSIQESLKVIHYLPLSTPSL